MYKVLVIVGPTAVGKSSFGIECAKAFNGEIISGDSVQIYKGLDIGSAKIKKEEMMGITHHLIDIKDARETYNVKDFQGLARTLIEDISRRNKLPIIVGGTGLYVKACLYDYRFNDEDTEDEPYDELSNEDIYNILKEKDPLCLNKIHINNRRRLVRALNVLNKTGDKFSANIESQNHELLYDAKIIGLTMDRDKLYERINSRVDMMVNDGLVDEIKGLLEKGVSFDDQAMQGIGYKEFRSYFEEGTSLDKVLDEIKRNSRRFAKRQYTWFKNQMPVTWFETSELDKAILEVDRWINCKD